MTSSLTVVNGSAINGPGVITPVSKADWDAFVDQSPQGSIYCKSWWLDAVCPDAYELIAIRDGGLIRAGMALPITRERGRSIVQMPPLTQTLGPLLHPPPGQKYESQLTYEIKILRELVAAIPPADEFFINCSQKFTNWLPFHWAGYSQATRYTYEIDDLTDLRAVYDGMSDKTRNIIRKAEKAGIRIEERDDLASVLPLFEMTYTRQGMEFPYDSALIARLEHGALANAGRKIFVARDGVGRLHAALYVIHTAQRTYYIMQGTDPDLRASGAPLLAHWHAIQFAATVSKRYDFVGSMMENVERVFRSFGAVQKPYFSIFRDNRRTTFRELVSVGKKLLLQQFTPVAALLICQMPDLLPGSGFGAAMSLA
jgi:Acetyltransferase (GNAT) domain